MIFHSYPDNSIVIPSVARDLFFCVERSDHEQLQSFRAIARVTFFVATKEGVAKSFLCEAT